ncbi:prolyl-tRNA synthetase associated domain-containing protein [Qipengyuania vesicularis]|uniref:prolyl-tRNA synthetase associated domain-containing protein n=1 Tax=Qipengyuania vesicularis TaxID=2867232 RepID=UPI001C889588|nr:prolyl-tRNA synthetase associated domain-containing protein [Qipengyuania vesicularis]MBX7527934.1 prolyl-tRNA synthetase associated domain-containing protein [Qipengyuania vesicularis]
MSEHKHRGEAGLREDLDALAIPFEHFEHEAVFTVEESAGIKAAIPGEHTKNLFLKDAGGAFWLVTVPGEMRVDLKALPGAIGCKRVSFGKPEPMLELLGLTPGSVTPLGAIHAPPGSITVVLDCALAEADRINVHPLRNTATIGLSGADTLRLLEHWGHAPMIADIPALESE